MKCKYCGRSGVPEGSSYCNWCGKQIVRTRGARKKEVKVPQPKPLANGGYYIKFQVTGAYQYVTAATEQECIAKAVAIKAGIANKQQRIGKTLDVVVEDYIGANRSVLSPSTIRGYETIRRTRFRRYMDQPVDKIKWQNMINDEKASPKTIKNAWALITSALKASGYPEPRVNLPSMVPAQRPYLEPEQIKTLVSLVKDDAYCIPILLALHGLRRSEIFAVTWADVDLSNDTIRVQGSVVRDPDGNLIEKASNKTTASTRTVPIMIPELKSALESAERVNDHVVTVPIDSLYKRINRICENNGLPCVGVHGLRHSFASLAYHLGIPMEVTCLLGGWADSKTVRDIYLHLYNADVVQQQNTMKAFYSDAGNVPK